MVIPITLCTFHKIEAATTANATITYTIGSIDSISISGSPGPLVINSATAGSAPTGAVDSSTSYSVTTNNTSRMVTGSLATDMPTGVSLSVNLDAPDGSTSEGDVVLSSTPICLVDGISNIFQGALGVTYTLTATVDASCVTGATNTVTFTVQP